MALPNLWQVLQPGALTERPKLGTNVAKGLSCGVLVLFIFSGEPPLSFSVEKRRDPKKSRTAKAFSYIRTEFGELRSRRLAVKPATN